MKTNLTLLATVSLLMACASDTALNQDGSPAGELHWPNPQAVQLDQYEGTFPNVDNLRNIRPNMSRDQLYDLLGKPHFSEGFRVREWNYLFHFDTPNNGTDGVTTCEYKVLFDKELRAQNYYWKAIDPADAICPPKGKSNVFTFSADALFAFDKNDLAHMTAGREKLNHLSEKLQKVGNNSRIEVRGYTDNLGDDAYNQQLSQQRAETVKSYLRARGVAAPISAYGYGESYPKVSCPRTGNRATLVRCLAPNRRVEVEVR